MAQLLAGAAQAALSFQRLPANGAGRPPIPSSLEAPVQGGPGCRRWLKVCILFASAYRGSAAFFFFFFFPLKQEEGEKKAESSNSQALGCFSP